jgi:hypothetical protein
MCDQKVTKFCSKKIEKNKAKKGVFVEKQLNLWPSKSFDQHSNATGV